MSTIWISTLCPSVVTNSTGLKVSLDFVMRWSREPVLVISGVGALYVRRRPRVRLEPLMSGGGQERGIRSGTVPTPLVVGLGKACELCLTEMTVSGPVVMNVRRAIYHRDVALFQYDHEHVSKLAKRLIDTVMAALPDVVRNGDPNHHYPGKSVCVSSLHGARMPGTWGVKIIEE